MGGGVRHKVQSAEMQRTQSGGKCWWIECSCGLWGSQAGSESEAYAAWTRHAG